MTYWTIIKHTNWWKTLYVNFKTLPFHQAKHLPIVMFGKCDLLLNPNCIAIEQNEHFQFGMIRIGNLWSSVHGWNTQPHYTHMEIRGKLIFRGRCFIGNGALIYVDNTAELELGDRVTFNADAKITCYNRISIGDYTRIAWETQILDTNFHYVADEKGVVHNHRKTIYIGKNCWIGNRVSIMGGSKLADWTTIASNSLVNKDISNVERGMFGGTPVKLIKTGLRRVFNWQSELMLNDFFSKHPDGEIVLKDNEISY